MKSDVSIEDKKEVKKEEVGKEAKSMNDENKAERVDGEGDE